MKANEAPEKIYIPTADDELHYHMTCPNNDFQESVEYTRTDAFIEKALRWMISQGGVNDALSKEMIEDFINYIKGE